MNSNFNYLEPPRERGASEWYHRKTVLEMMPHTHRALYDIDRVHLSDFDARIPEVHTYTYMMKGAM